MSVVDISKKVGKWRAGRDAQETGRGGETLSRWAALKEEARSQEKQGKTIPVLSVDELPPWDSVLNDVGGPLKQLKRNPHIAVISAKAGEGAAGEPPRECMFIVAPGYRKAAQALVAPTKSAGYKLVAVLEDTDSRVLLVLYNEWDARHGKGEGTTGGGAKVTQWTQAFDDLVQEAVKLRASDIHLTAERGRGKISFRIDGRMVVHDADRLDAWVHSVCSVAVNYLADPSSRKDNFLPTTPQDCVIDRTLSATHVRLRYEHVPIEGGFDAVMRVIVLSSSSERFLKLPQLGYSVDQQEEIERIFGHATGLVLLTGKVNTGKSTTVATMLHRLVVEQPGKKIRTVEEPIERVIPGVYQTPVKRLHGDSSDFLSMLTAMVRTDFDTLFVGEIRDADTAALALQTVMSGHLCITTLHAASALVSFDRLSGMGASRKDLATPGVLIGIIYQTLVATLCSHCKVPAASALDQPEFAAIQGTLHRASARFGSLDGIFVARPKGCGACKGRGVVGRTACAEIFSRPSMEMLRAIANGDAAGLREAWRATRQDDPRVMVGRTAFEHGCWKVREGLVSPVDLEAEFHYLDQEAIE